LGADWLGSPKRNIQFEYPIHRCLDYDFYDLDVQLVSRGVPCCTEGTELIIPMISIIGVVSPLMLENLAHGGTYFFFAAFAVLGFFTTCEYWSADRFGHRLIGTCRCPLDFFLPETRLKVSAPDGSTDTMLGI
jgi:hypothetical protein